MLGLVLRVDSPRTTRVKKETCTTAGSMVYVSEVKDDAHYKMMMPMDGEEDMIDEGDYEDIIDDQFNHDTRMNEYTLENSNLFDKIVALKFLIPLSIRQRVAKYWNFSKFHAYRGFIFMGNSFWIITTSLFLIGFPIFYEYQREQSLLLMEKEQRLFPSSSGTNQIMEQR